MIRDKIDKILDCLPEEELENVYWSIVFIQEDYLYKQNLREKGVVIEVVNEAEKIIDLWDKRFAQNISEGLKEEIYYEQFKWHIFSYEKQKMLGKGSCQKSI